MVVLHSNHSAATIQDLVSQDGMEADEANMKDLFLLRSKTELHNLDIFDHPHHFLAGHNIPTLFQESLEV